MSDLLTAALRAELDSIEQRKEIVEEALAKLAEVNGAMDIEEVEPAEPEERAERGWLHPTLGRITISRDQDRWERSWKYEAERVLKAIDDNPHMKAIDLAREAHLSPGQTSSLLRFLEVEGTIEADREADRLVRHRPGKTYHRVEPLPPSKPKSKPKKRRRKRGATAATLVRLVTESPGVTTSALAAEAKLNSNYVAKALNALEREGKVRHEKQGTSRVKPFMWYPVEPARETRVTPGEGVEAGRLRFPSHVTDH